MSLQNEIDKLKTLQESFNELSSKVLDTQAVLTELNHGKQEIASSINFKGTETNAEKSLSELALDIRKIQNVSKEFQAIDYMEDVVGMRSAMEFINDVATNDYVAYACYVLGVGSKFNVATNPSAMYMSDGTLILSPNGEYEVVPYDGNSYGAVVLAYTGRNILTEILSNDILQIALYNAKIHIPVLPSNIKFFFTKSCELTFEEKALVNLVYFYNDDIEFIDTGVFYGSTSIQYVNMPNLKAIGTQGNNIGLLSNSSVISINMPKLETVNPAGGGMGHFQNTKLTSFYLPSLTSSSDSRLCQSTQTVKYIYLPLLTKWPNTMCYECTSLIEAILPSVVTMENRNNIFQGALSLINVMIGELDKSTIAFQKWIPTNVLASEEKVKILDTNIRNNIAMRIADLTGLTAQTLTFSQEVRNIFSAETEAVFAAKNWNISPAKSV